MNEQTTLQIYQLETTNACNLRCSFCPTFMPWNERKTGLMDLDLIDRVDWSQTFYTELQFGGEPLIHPDLPEIIQRVKAKGVRVGFSTNAHPDFKDRLAAILDEVDIITVNDDAFRKPMFQDRSNVFVQQLGVTYMIEDYTRTQEPHDIPYCETPFKFVSIMYNGDVVPCCKDHSGINILGNLYEQTLYEIEHGEARQKFLQGMKDNQPNGICEYCDAPNPHKIHEGLIELMDERGRPLEPLPVLQET